MDFIRSSVLRRGDHASGNDDPEQQRLPSRSPEMGQRQADTPESERGGGGGGGRFTFSRPAMPWLFTPRPASSRYYDDDDDDGSSRIGAAPSEAATRTPRFTLGSVTSRFRNHDDGGGEDDVPPVPQVPASTHNPAEGGRARVRGTGDIPEEDRPGGGGGAAGTERRRRRRRRGDRRHKRSESAGGGGGGGEGSSIGNGGSGNGEEGRDETSPRRRRKKRRDRVTGIHKYRQWQQHRRSQGEGGQGGGEGGETEEPKKRFLYCFPWVKSRRLRTQILQCMAAGMLLVSLLAVCKLPTTHHYKRERRASKTKQSNGTKSTNQLTYPLQTSASP